MAVGIVGESIGAGLAVLRGVAAQPVLRSRAVWRPRFVPTRLQPATLVTEVARRGARHRARTAEQVGALLDQWTPALVELVVSRLDLTSLVLRHVDIDRVVAAADLDAAVAGVDLDAVVQRVDLVAVVEQVLAAIDLPAIIRDSSGSMASETVRGARMTGITVDEAISRALERRLFRRRRAPRPDGDEVVDKDELSVVPSEARTYQGTAAGIATRFAANTIDGLVVVVWLLAA